jgi:hypothetical protein
MWNRHRLGRAASAKRPVLTWVLPAELLATQQGAVGTIVDEDRIDREFGELWRSGARPTG